MMVQMEGDGWIPIIFEVKLAGLGNGLDCIMGNGSAEEEMRISLKFLA